MVIFTSCGAPDSAPDEPDDPSKPPTPQHYTGDESGAVSESPTQESVSGGIPATPSTSPTPSTLTSDGWGPIRIGMTRAEVVAAAGDDANPDAVGGPDPEMCDQFRPEQAPEGLLVMIERDRLTRITLSAGTGISTERGFGVGDPAARIKEAYGSDAVVSPHEYSTAPAEYITVWKTAPDAPDARGLVYEIGPDGRVRHIHAGTSSIQYVEGCL
ncbi:MAG TPA: hypothetical protein VFI91_04975 [Longimicrobiaceae bacterium]|nr:hypothetical protein [Longimicrobiaceae bacterium]